MKITAVILSIAILLIAGSVPASEPSLPIDAYWRLLQEIQERVIALEGKSPEVIQAELAALADRLEAVTGVVLPDGTRLPLDHSFLAARMRAEPPNLAQVNELLTTLLALRHTWPQPTSSPGDTEALKQILARPEFQWQPEEPSPFEEWWRRIQEQIWEFLSRTFAGEAAGLLRYTLTILGILALAAVLVYALRNVWVNVIAEDEASMGAEAGDLNLTSATALKRAQMLADEKDYRAAVRYLYLSSLLFLEERGLLHYDRSLTNREYLRSVAQSPQLFSILGRVVEIFERVWYGYRPLDETTYAQYAAWVEDLHQLR